LSEAARVSCGNDFIRDVFDFRFSDCCMSCLQTCVIHFRARKAADLPFPVSPSRKVRGGEAPEGATKSPRLAARAPKWGRVAFQRSTAAFLSPGPCFRARQEGSPSPIRQAFVRLRRRLVQPLKAVPLSRDGRRPRASRCRGYEPRQQAPHPPRALQRPAGRPSRGEGEM
jgi:hypothetical protein